MFVTKEQINRLIEFYRDEHNWTKAMGLIRFREWNNGRLFPIHMPEELS